MPEKYTIRCKTCGCAVTITSHVSGAKRLRRVDCFTCYNKKLTKKRW